MKFFLLYCKNWKVVKVDIKKKLLLNLALNGLITALRAAPKQLSIPFNKLHTLDCKCHWIVVSCPFKFPGNQKTREKQCRRFLLTATFQTWLTEPTCVPNTNHCRAVQHTYILTVWQRILVECRKWGGTEISYQSSCTAVHCSYNLEKNTQIVGQDSDPIAHNGQKI